MWYCFASADAVGRMLADGEVHYFRDDYIDLYLFLAALRMRGLHGSILFRVILINPAELRIRRLLFCRLRAKAVACTSASSSPVLRQPH